MARRLVPFAEALGIDATKVGDVVGLDRAALDDPEGRLPLDNVLDAIERVLAAAPHAAAGLVLASTGQPDAYHTPGLVMLASENVKEGFERAFEVQRLWGDGDRFALVPAEQVCGVAGWAVVFRLPAARHDPATSVLEVCALAESLSAVRGLTADFDAKPRAWGVPVLAGDAAAHSDFFGGPPRLGVEAAFIAFDREPLERPIPTAHALYRSIFESQAQRELAQLPPEGAGLKGDVRTFIARGLAAGRFDIDRCASSLGLSKRTLERRLAEVGTSYKAEIDEVRKDAAKRWLEEGRRVEDVAALLGYSERAAFHRACLRWFERTPAQLRGKSQESRF